MAQTKDKIEKTRQLSENGEMQNRTKSHTSTHTEKEQARTTFKKKTFLEVYERLLCSVSSSCRAISIGRGTYYDWYRNDPDFRKACREIQAREFEMAEDILKELVLKRKESSVHFFLRSVHPKYKPSRVMIEPVKGEKSITELLREEPEEEKSLTAAFNGEYEDKGK